MEIKASAKYLRISPFKLRLVTRSISGKKVEEALALLRFMPQRGARCPRWPMPSSGPRLTWIPW
jgi:large subunit ribosomal protein L22